MSFSHNYISVVPTVTEEKKKHIGVQFIFTNTDLHKISNNLKTNSYVVRLVSPSHIERPSYQNEIHKLTILNF